MSLDIKMINTDTIRVTNIQRMCFHDGPGIRTTVFLKGCSLHCPWCSNPENISFEIEQYDLDGERGIFGKDYSVEELLGEITKDRMFWGCEGGVTFSGGEPLMHVQRLIPLMSRLREDGINIAVETSLFAPKDSIISSLDYVDFVIVDVKILDSNRCKMVLGGDLEQYLDNADIVYKSGKLRVFRLPLCYEYTFNADNKDLLVNFLMKYKDIPVQLFGVHALGEHKYQALDKTCWHGQNVDEEDLSKFMSVLSNHGINAEIIRI